MNLSHFAFAFYVFLLVCAAIWFYSRMAGGGKKKDKGSFEKEQRLFQLYQNVEDMLASFEEYTEDAKAGIDERIRQAQALIDGVCAGAYPVGGAKSDQKSDKNKSSGRGTAAAKPSPAKKPQQTKNGESSKSAPAKPKAEEMILQYLEKGMNKEEIAKALGISSREVSLIMEIKHIKIPGKKTKESL